MGIESLPEELNKVVQESIQADNSDNYQELEKERLKIEQQRIKAEERIQERQAERDEKVAEINSLQGFWEGKFAALESKLDSMFLRSTPSVAIDASHEANEIPTAAEDIPQEEEKATEIPEEAAEETIEELGAKEQEVENKVSEPVKEVEEKVNNETGRGRRKRRGRR